MGNSWLENNEVSVYNIFELLYLEKIEYIYRGEFDSKITDGILSLAEVNLSDQKDTVKVRKRVFFILVEGLQNITRHQDQVEEVEADEYNEGFLAIQRKENEYVITTGNLIKREDLEQLKTSLDIVNSLSKQELKDYYRQILDNNTFSQKGGAGLGLIEIARKSGNKLAYDFQNISATHSYFYMQTKINYTKDEVGKQIVSLENIKSIHQYTIKNDIILNVTGIFNHDKLVYLISIMESHMSKQSVLKNKMFSIMIELMQNIVKHADDIEIDTINGKHSIFYITTNNHEVSLNSGNFIKNSKISRVKAHLDKINHMTHNELNKFHFETLLNYKTEKKISYGLGMLDMRIKSRNAIGYNLHKVNKDFSFLSLKINLKQEYARSRVFKVEADDESPEILLNERTGEFLFCGDSYPENAFEFYAPVLEWLEEYSKNSRLFTLFEFKFRFLSTSSQKELIKILKILEKIAQSSAVVVKWYFQKGNDDAFAFGLEFSKLFNIDFDLVEFNEIDCIKKPE